MCFRSLCVQVWRMGIFGRIDKWSRNNNDFGRVDVAGSLSHACPLIVSESSST
jgi:hypothetical protein